MSRLWAVPLLIAASLTAGGAGMAADVTVTGRLLRLSARADDPARRAIVFRTPTDTALVPPFPEPTAGSSLRIFAGTGPGQCSVDTPLDPGLWAPLGGDGSTHGWRYLDKAASTGVRKIVLKPRNGGGKLGIKMKGANVPCDLTAETQNLPVSLELSVADTTYCAAFGGTVVANKAGRFKAKDAPAPTACLASDVTIANLNVLHGLFCPPATGFCRLDERIDLLGQWIVERGCPDVVALQEVFQVAGGSIPDLVDEKLLDICPFPYRVTYGAFNNFDDSLVLSRYAALDSQVLPLLNDFRNVHHVRIDHPVGPIDVFSTHLASGADNATDPCTPPCPAECVAAGATTIRECQAEQTALIVESLHDVPGPAFLVGDMNAEPGSFETGRFTGRGWIDTHLAAGNPECDALTGIGCTTGRSEPEDLEDPALNVDRRIDYIFLVPSGVGADCLDLLDDPTDADGDGTGTGLFGEAPNPFAPSCGPLPDPICWISDHTGNEADLDCE